jgi:hypothetical protein
MNAFGFAEGDPVNLEDPFGLCPPIEDCLQQAANWGAVHRGALGSAVLNTAAGLNSVNDFNLISGAFDAGWDIGSGNVKRGVLAAGLTITGGEIGKGLKGASVGLRALFSESGGLVEGSIIGVRAALKESGFVMRLAESKRGYLFTKGGEEVRVMQGEKGWYMRVRNAAGNYLDSNGNPGGKASTHLPLNNH